MAGQTDEEFDALVAAWHARRDSQNLYRALRDPMRQAARKGIRRISRSAPDEHDVDSVVLRAFQELLEKDPAEIRSVVGLARTVAYRRGMDRGRQINRERKQLRQHVWELNDLRVSAQDELAAADRERLLRHAEECIEELTDSQRDVIEFTVKDQKLLSDWTMARGTSYEAGRRMLTRGLQTLRRCIDRKLNNDREGEF